MKPAVTAGYGAQVRGKQLFHDMRPDDLSAAAVVLIQGNCPVLHVKGSNPEKSWLKINPLPPIMTPHPP